MIVDTDILVEMLRSEVDYRIERWMNAQPVQPGTTAIAIAEILAGIGLVENQFRRGTLQMIIRGITEKSFAHRIMPFDDEAAQLYGQMVEHFRPGSGFHVVDLQVAAIALSRRKPLATRRPEVFQQLGVEVFDPFNPSWTPDAD